MHKNPLPTTRKWYLSKEISIPFMVVAVDSEQNLVEIQHFDGDIEELDFDVWHNMKGLEETAEPKDAYAPYELSDSDILELFSEEEASLHNHEAWLDPLSAMQKDDWSWRDN